MRVGKSTNESARLPVAIVLAVTAMALASVQGCSLFQTRTGATQDGNAFHATASTMNNPVPLPVEIVSDISTIQSGGEIRQGGVWRPTINESGELRVDRITAPGEAATPHLANQPGAPTVQPPEQLAVGLSSAEEQPGTASSVDAERTAANAPRLKIKRRLANVNRGTGSTEQYRVRHGDTLMKIAFEKFGNVYRWREIHDTNRAKLGDSTRLTPGDILIIAGIEYVVIQRNGVPYLIRRNDTLGKISKSVYGVTEHWRAIWKNNPQLIHNPNKIYAGFTLYYQKNLRALPAARRVSSEPLPPLKTALAPAVAPGVAPALAPATVPAAPGSEATGSAWKPTSDQPTLHQ